MGTKHQNRLIALALSILTVAGCQAHLPWQTADNAKPVTQARRQTSKSNVTPRQTADVQISMGRLMERRGQLDEAEQAYGAALKQDPKRAVSYWRLAILHDRRGDFERSGQLFQQALERSPGNPEIFCDIGYSLYIQKRWQAAEMNLKQAIALQPNLDRAHNNLGLLLARTNRLDEAIVAFRRSKCNPAEIEENLAFAMKLEGQWDQALNHYTRALALAPNSNTAKRGLRDLHASLAHGKSGDNGQRNKLVWLEEPIDAATPVRRVATTQQARTPRSNAPRPTANVTSPGRATTTITTNRSSRQAANSSIPRATQFDVARMRRSTLSQTAGRQSPPARTVQPASRPSRSPFVESPYRAPTLPVSVGLRQTEGQPRTASANRDVFSDDSPWEAPRSRSVLTPTSANVATQSAIAKPASNTYPRYVPSQRNAQGQPRSLGNQSKQQPSTESAVTNATSTQSRASVSSNQGRSLFGFKKPFGSR